MATKVFGYSDDSIYFEGDISGNVVGYPNTRMGTLLRFSDDTMLELKYAMDDLVVWSIKVIKKGKLLKKIDVCKNNDADPNSDIAYFADGLTWCYAAVDWQEIE